MNERGRGSPDDKLKSIINALLKEQGKSSPGLSTPQDEQPSHGGASTGAERKTRPSVWDILGRQVKLWAPGGPRMDREEFVREARQLKLLKEEIEEKGTARDKLSLALYELEKTFMRPDHPGRDILKLLGISRGNVLRQELHWLRSRVEAMSDEQLVDRVRWLESLQEV